MSEKKTVVGPFELPSHCPQGIYCLSHQVLFSVGAGGEDDLAGKRQEEGGHGELA